MTSSPGRDPKRPKENPPVTRLRVWCRMVRNLFVYGRPIPPRYIFREEPK